MLNLASERRPRIGVYRTVFPQYSETFISEQLRTYSAFAPVLICRDLLDASSDVQAVSVGGRVSAIKRILFTAGVVGAFRDLSAVRDLKLVHAHFAPDAILARPIARALHVPLIVTCHGSDVMMKDSHLVKSARPSNLRYLANRGALMRDARAFIAVSEFLRSSMIERGFPVEKVFTNYIGVDTDKFAPAERANSQRRYILNIARHAEVKGIDVLLRAFAKVAPLFPGVQLLQIGAGPLTAQLRRLADELDVADRVEFLGSMPSHNVIPYIQQANMVVLSSRRASSGAEEAFGLALIEASACGVPCIGTDVGGIPEAVHDGRTGLIVSAEKPLLLANAIASLLWDPDTSERMGKNGREMVCTRFDLQNQTRRLEGLYMDLISSFP